MRKVIILIILVLVIVTILSNPNFKKVFGYGILIVSSGSMFPEIDAGEIIIIKEKDTYEIGDIITSCIDNKYLVTHRIVDIEKDKYVMKGDNNNCVDERLIEKEEIEGKVIFHSKLLGKIYYYRYYIFIVFILILIFLIIF